MASKKLQIQQARLEKHLAEHDPALLVCLADLVKAREQALSASQMKSEFLANMSHEIRTPLHGIVGTTDLLMETAQNKEQLELLQTLKISNETLLHIINDVLDFSKVEHGQLKVEERSFELGEICDSVIQLFQSTAEDKRLQLISHYHPEKLPRIVGDPLRLRQIISNLVSNALKFTLQGQVRLAVKLDDSKIAITVTDTGGKA